VGENAHVCGYRAHIASARTPRVLPPCRRDWRISGRSTRELFIVFFQEAPRGPPQSVITMLRLCVDRSWRRGVSMQRSGLLVAATRRVKKGENRLGLADHQYRRPHAFSLRRTCGAERASGGGTILNVPHYGRREEQ
jgi:hypothetical protein